jgi:hypothetical protein
MAFFDPFFLFFSQFSYKIITARHQKPEISDSFVAKIPEVEIMRWKKG